MSIAIPLMLSAIAAVESGGNPAAVGAHGERSAFQMMETTWQQHAAEHGVNAGDFAANAATPEIAERVGTARLVWLCKQLEAHKQPVTVETLAAAWKSPTRAFAGQHSVAVKDYAQRVKNIYEDLLTKHPATVPIHLLDSK